METKKLGNFARYARRNLMEQVTIKLERVLAVDSGASREQPEAVKELNNAIKEHDKEQVVERVAYTWFNRFCALRFMDVNRYTRIGVVSPASGQFQPEILADAKMGYIDEQVASGKIRQHIIALLNGKAPSHDPQGEAYRLLLVGACNYWHPAMPFLFERIGDYTELLMPDDLLSGNSILAYTREAMTPNACRDVEVVGWLYQFYIAEKKDEIFAGLKKNIKISAENIPAATQLFTPHWIVRYLVENSLGRLWLLNRPGSRLIERMDFYIEPEQVETDFIRITTPEEIKICDPACGSGHMLVYAFDLLYAIYEEEGYDPDGIPEKILTRNLYGIEIDERAGALAAFALAMKARARQRRFFDHVVQPNICVLQNIRFGENELQDYMDFIGRDLFTAQLQTTLHQLNEAKHFGSLIRLEVTGVARSLQTLEDIDIPEDLFLGRTHELLLQALRQVDYLSPRYHIVIANPPYMGGRGMNGRLGVWLKENYVDVKSDLFSAFILRNTELTLPKGQLGFMSPFVWMFISSYEKLRGLLINQKTITSLVQLEYSGFDGATVPICTFTLENAHHPDFKGGYVRLSDFRGSENQAPKTLEAINNPDCGWFYRASSNDFQKIPGSPIAYWASFKQRHAFEEFPTLGSWSPVKQGLATANNDLFLRNWHEVSHIKTGFNYQELALTTNGEHKWFPYNKGGNFRRWYGNVEFLVNWENDGNAIRNFADYTGYIRSRAQNTEYYLKKGVTWTDISSSYFGVRLTPAGFLFDVAGSSAFPEQTSPEKLTAFLGSCVTPALLKLMNPTLHFQVGNIATLPVDPAVLSTMPNHIPASLISTSKADWDAYETAWDFTTLPLLSPEHRQTTLAETYAHLRDHWRGMTGEMQRLEQENNRIFIDAYGLQDELTPEVPVNEITLTSNPHYRYDGNKSEEELEVLLLTDTMREFISYAVGCMFGRYALEEAGLILANQGDGIAEYLSRVPEPGFEPDADNVIPILDGDWFVDDIVGSFRDFLRLTFGDEHYEANLRFIEQALGKNGNARDLRDYFLKDFYRDHVKRYKKRPIYWLFSSPGSSFNALIYMHRYRPDTVGVVLNDYLREFRAKLTSRKHHLEAVSVNIHATQRDKTKALKETEKLNRIIVELEEYEREVLYPLATKQVEIDLDDGVKLNYPKFGAALKKIPGL